MKLFQKWALAPAASTAGHRDESPVEWIGYAFVAFFTIPFLLFNIAPIFFGAYVSFTKWGVFGKPTWIGLQNFYDAFNDEFVWIAFKNTVLYSLVIVPCVVVIGFAFALYVNQRWPLSALARTLFFSPYVVSATVIGLVWVWMLDTQFGLINHYLGILGIENVPWLTSAEWSLLGVSIASVWWDLGLAFVLFLAALQDVPRDLYEAAEIDGANPWQRLWLVVVPQLRPVISLVVTLQLISTLRIFSQVYVMTNGGPASSSSSVIFYMYGEAIQRQKFGYASAVAVLLFLLIIVITIIYRRLFGER
ncbi:MAG: carbohydrate ABC transporter permease [Dongiaceae bacterium]